MVTTTITIIVKCSMDVQFANIAGPGIGLQPIQTFLVDTLYILARFAAVTVDAVIAEKPNVFLPLSQRRNFQRKHVDAVVQVAAEGAGFDGSGQVTMQQYDG